jgi:L-ascorbate metabolism protein UlaG (beta-lactamase superfamily)
MNYTLLRNATAVLVLGGKRFLIDPMLDPRGARPPIGNTPNQHPNPLVDLPAGWEGTMANVDAVVVTHLHKDHFDDTAARDLDPVLPLLAQPEDVEPLQRAGFRDVRPSAMSAMDVDGVTLTRTGGRHGTGDVGEAMAPVSGYVFDAPNESCVYVAGDTIWCAEVEHAIDTHKPDVIVLNAGGARFLEGDPIVMTADDVVQVNLVAPDALLIVVHLEAINHCLETRQYYREVLPALGVPTDRFRLPENGESVIW